MNEYIKTGKDEIIKGTDGEIHIDKDGNVIKIIGGHTFNGECYKSLDAWEKGEGIIYVSEYGIIDWEKREENNVGLEDIAWTRDTWIDWVYDRLADTGLGCENDMEFVAYIAEDILKECDWQDLSTGLDEWLDGEGLEETWDEWCKGKI